MQPTIAAATPADLPAIFQILDDNRLPRAGLDAHLATTLVARDDGADVDAAVLGSAELTTACPKSALVMVRSLR